jgi:two-component system, NtrC family, response regulator HydG
MGARVETLLVVDNEPDFVAITARDLTRAGYEVLTATSISECRALLEERFVDLVLLDEQLGREFGTRYLAEMRKGHPGLAAVIVTGFADLDLVLRAMRAGAIDLLPKRFGAALLLETVRHALDESQVTREARRHRWYAYRDARFPEIIGESDVMRKLIEEVRRVAASNATVLIEGESGTGKELIARAIHAASPRRHQPFVCQNVGALPPTLTESILFGARKGIYTDAKADRKGLFETASQGTLFLDEIGDAPHELQVDLLRVLEQHTVTRLGDSIERPVDVRIIAATHHNLKGDVDAKRFRQDLYYRLNVVPIQVPSLRERVEDIEPLAVFLLAQQAKEQGKCIQGFDRGSLDKLREHQWPGNVRELRNVIERAVIHVQDKFIRAPDLRLDGTGPSSAGLEAVLELPFREAVSEFEQRFFCRLLQRTNGNKTKAAKLAGIDRTVLHKHLVKLPGAVSE